jgi:hypothetical protein
MTGIPVWQKPKYPHNPGYQDNYLNNQWEW